MPFYHKLTKISFTPPTHRIMVTAQTQAGQANALSSKVKHFLILRRFSALMAVIFLLVGLMVVAVGRTSVQLRSISRRKGSHESVHQGGGEDI